MHVDNAVLVLSRLTPCYAAILKIFQAAYTLTLCVREHDVIVVIDSTVPGVRPSIDLYGCVGVSYLNIKELLTFN